MPRPEKMRLIAPELMELRLDASEELMKKIQRVRELKGELGLAEIFSRALEAYLEVEDPLRKLKRAELRASRKIERERRVAESAVDGANPAVAQARGEANFAGDSTRAPESTEAHGATRAPESAASPQTPPVPKNPRSRYLAASTRASTWVRSRGQCEYRDPKTGARCQSRYRLEFEHVRPFARGGSNGPSNIQNLCKQHNLLSALQAYGHEKMATYLKL